MITLHGLWQPLTDDSVSPPGLIIWAENTISALNITRKKVDGILKKKRKNIDKKIQKSNKITVENKQSATSNAHPFIEDPNILLSKLVSNSQKLNSKSIKFKEINESKLNPKINETNFKIKIIESYFPIPTWNNIPILSDYFKLMTNNYWRENEEQSRLITVKIANLINSCLENQTTDFKLKLWKIKCLRLDLDESIKFFKLINPKIEDPLSTMKIRIADDLRFWYNAYKWISQQIIAGLVYPSILDSDELRNQFYQLTKSMKPKKTYIGWWNHKVTKKFQSKFNNFTSQIPFSARIKIDNEYNPSIENREVIHQKLIEGVHTGKIIFNDYLLLMTNQLMRVNLNNNLKQKISRYKGYSKIGYLELIIKSLFSYDSSFILPSDEDTYWFVQQFNSWCTQGNNDNFDDYWNICLQIIPPEDDLSDEWGLSFLFKHKLDNKSIISVFQIIESPHDPIICGNYILDKPLEVFIKKIHMLTQSYPLFNTIINKENLFYHPLSKNHLDQLLAMDETKLQKLGYEILLPRSIKNKFILRDQIKLQISIDVKKKNSSSILLDYDLKVIIDNSEVTLDEILKLADARSNLVEIAGKWIHFDTNEAKKIQKLLKQNMKNLELLDILKLEAGDYSILDEGKELGKLEKGRDFSIRLDTISNLKDQIYLPKTDKITAIVGLNAKLREYQKTGMNWIVNLTNWGLSGCLADDMGLGKTIQVLSAIQYLKNQKLITRPILVIAPTSILGNWLDECEKFTPNLNISLHHGTKRTKTITRMKREFLKQDIILISYGILRIDAKHLGKINWSGVILDEAQKIKNPATNSYKIATSLSSDFRIALTGTPIENRLSELWSIFNFLLPNYLGGIKSFKEKFIIPIERDYDDERLNLLRKLIQPFMVSRKKTDKKIIQDLPNKIEKNVYCPMSKEQVALYHATMEASLAALENAENIKRRGIILATIGKLKQICNHPSNFLKEKDHSISNSGKLQSLMELVELITNSGEKVLIFSQYKFMCSLIYEVIKEKFNIKSLFLHGSVLQKKRQQMIDIFNSDPLTNNVFIISLRAGGLGLNLTAATHVIHYDRWWNPAVENQATDRAYRIGQANNVMVYKFITKGTIEEHIDKIITGKRDLVDKFMGGVQKQVTELDNDELVELMKLRNTTISNETI